MSRSTNELSSARRAGGYAAVPRPARRTRLAPRVALLPALLGVLATASAAGGTWTTVAPMPTARSNFVLAESNGILYAVGGYAGTTTPFATLEAYDPATDAWTSRAPMPTARHDAGGAFVNGILYVVGGFDFPTWQPIATVEAYDPATDTWTTKEPMPTARYGPGVAAVDGILYVVGGVGAGSGPQTNLDTVEAYDPATDTWTARASMPTARNRLGAASVGGLLYAVGGKTEDSAGSYLATTEAYDPATDSWTTRASLPATRVLPGLGVLDGLVYAVGGQTSTNGFSNVATVLAYDPASDAWTARPPMPTARHSLGVAVSEGTLYAVGGANDVTWFATAEALVPDANDDPVADAGADQTLGATSSDGAEATLDGTDSFDPDGDSVTFQWSAPAGVVLDDPTSATPEGTFPVGVHLVTLTVSDGRGGLDTDDVVVRVEDAGAPEVACTTDLAALWPPNHQRVEVEVRIAASDTVSDPSDLVLRSVEVTSDEPDDAHGNGDGSTTGDVEGADGFTAAVDATASFAFDAASASFVGLLDLRAERSTTGDGRSYGIRAVVEDASGNATTATCVVVVPHSRGR